MAAANPPNHRIPVILDTDIGDWIDDHYAMLMMLHSPELDVKLVVSAFGNTTVRAKIIAKALETSQRTDVHVGVGVPSSRQIAIHAHAPTHEQHIHNSTFQASDTHHTHVITNSSRQTHRLYCPNKRGWRIISLSSTPVWCTQMAWKQ